MTHHAVRRPEELGTLVTVFAHPDDEAYLAGGLLAAARDAGQRVVCVTATRGEAADPLASPEDRAALAATRSEELAAALSVLGVREHHWLDLPDGACAELDPTGPVERLAALLDQIRPDTVVTFGPDGFTGHPDHRAVSGWVDQALEQVEHGDRVRLLHAVTQEHLVDREIVARFDIYAAGEPRFCADDELALRLTLASGALERKVRALLSQTSQTAALVEAIGVDRFAAWTSVECFAPPVTR